MTGDAPMLHRPRNPALERTDLTVRDVPKVYLDMLDAQSIAREKTRREVLLELLQREAKRWAHEQIVAQRVMGGNSVLQELAGMDVDTPLPEAAP